MGNVNGGLISQPGFEIAATGDVLEKGSRLVLLPFSHNHPKRKWAIDKDGFIYTQGNPELVFDVADEQLHEGNEVILWNKKASNNANQKWKVDASGSVFTELGGGFQLGVNDEKKLIITTKSSPWIYPYLGGVAVNNSNAPYTPKSELSFFSVTAVITLAGPTSTGRIWDKVTPYVTDGWYLDIYPALHLRGKASTVITAKAPLPIHVPTYVALTFDGHEVVIYTNGEKVGSAAAVGKLPTNAHPIRIGVDSDGKSKFEGEIKRTFLYDYPLSPDEIRVDYKHSLAGL